MYTDPFKCAAAPSEIIEPPRSSTITPKVLLGAIYPSLVRPATPLGKCGLDAFAAQTDLLERADDVDEDGLFARRVPVQLTVLDSAGAIVSESAGSAVFRLTALDRAAAAERRGTRAFHGFALQVVLRDDEQDPLFHYTFFGNGWSTRSVVRSQRLSLPGLEPLLVPELAYGGRGRIDVGAADAELLAVENAAVDTLERLVGEQLLRTLRDPERFSIALRQHPQGLTASFTEAAASYRRVELFHIDLRPTPWALVQADVLAERQRRRTAYEALRRRHRQLLDAALDACPAVVARTAPIAPNPAPPAPGVSAAAFRAAFARRAKQAVLPSELVEAVATRQLPVTLIYPDGSSSERATLTFTLYQRQLARPGAPALPPHAYFATVHAAENPFFHFTSSDVDRAAWARMVHRLVRSSAALDDTPETYRRPRQLSDDEARVLETVGFCPLDGATPGGLPGVLLDEFVGGCSANPDKFRAELRIRYPRLCVDAKARAALVPPRPSLPCSPVEQARLSVQSYSQSLADERRGHAQLPNSGFERPCEPPVFGAELVLVQDLGVRTASGLELVFERTSLDIIRSLIRADLGYWRQSQRAAALETDRLVGQLRKVGHAPSHRLFQVLSGTGGDSAVGAESASRGVSHIPASVLPRVARSVPVSKVSAAVCSSRHAPAIRQGAFDGAVLAKSRGDFSARSLGYFALLPC